MGYRTGKYTVFEVRRWLFQPENFTGWSSEGVNNKCISNALNPSMNIYLICEVQSAKTQKRRLEFSARD